MIKLELPIYQEITTGRGENKKRKSILIGVNNYRNWHYQIECKMKHTYTDLVKTRLKRVKQCLKENVRVSYNLYYKNSRMDLMNVISIIDKYLMDALQEMKIIENDNVKNYVECVSRVAGEDRANPRVEIIVEELQ